MKKGQIALFVIVAILLVSAIGFVVYSQREALGLKPAINPEIRPINSFIESCIQSAGESALFTIGKQGGYYIPPENAAGSIAYYFYDNKSLIPAKTRIESEISSYLNENLKTCANFSRFPDFGIESGKVNASAKILSNKVRFNVNWPITARKGVSTYQLNDFSAEIPSRFSAIYSTAEEITQQQLKSPQICLSCIIDYADSNNVYVSMENIDGNTILFTIRDNQTLINNQPYEFTFANKY